MILKIRKFGLPVWVWLLDLCGLLVSLKLFGFLLAVDTGVFLAKSIYRVFEKKHPKKSPAVLWLTTIAVLFCMGITLPIVIIPVYQYATMTPEEREKFEKEIAERNKITFLGVEIGGSLDADRYKGLPWQYESEGDCGHYTVRVPLAKKLFPINGFDIVNVNASVKSHLIYEVEIKGDEVTQARFSEYKQALEQMMRSKYGAKPEDSDCDNRISFELKNGRVYFRTGGTVSYFDGKLYTTGPYSTSLSYIQYDFLKIAKKEAADAAADAARQKEREHSERIKKTANAGLDLL